MKFHAAFALLLCASLSACTDGADPLAPEADNTLMARLRTPTTLEIDSDASLLAINAFTDQTADAMPINFTIVDGRVDVRADDNGDIVVHAFEFGLEDVSIAPDLFPPDGLQLRDLSVRMEYPVVATPEWTRSSASVEVAMDITAEWSGVFNGNTYALRSINLKDIIISADLALVDGRVSALVSGARAGTFWDWADKFEMADLVVEVDAMSR